MISIRRLAMLAAAGLGFATPSVAQTVDEQLAALVVTWIEEEAADMDPVVKEYGVGCLTPIVLAQPETARQAFITAGGMEGGIAAIEANDAATYATMFPPLQQCIEAMFVGEPIWAWVQVIEAGKPLEEQKAAAFCLMDGIKPLTTEQKQILYAATLVADADFEDALDALVKAQPETEPALQAIVEPCV